MDCSLRTQFNSLAWSWSLTIHLCMPYLSKLTPVFSITLPHWHAHHILFSQLTCLFTCLRNHQGLSHHLAFPLLFPQPWMAPFPVPSLHANALPPSQSSLGAQQPIFREATWETAAPPGWPGGHIHWGRCQVRKGCISQMRKEKFRPERGMRVQWHAVVVLDDTRASEAGVLWSWVSCHREVPGGSPHLYIHTELWPTGAQFPWGSDSEFCGGSLDSSSWICISTCLHCTHIHNPLATWIPQKSLWTTEKSFLA